MRITKLIAAAAIAVSAMATTVSAGGFSAVVTEPVVIIPAPIVTRSTWGIILPLLGVGLLIALAMADDTEGEDE